MRTQTLTRLAAALLPLLSLPAFAADNDYKISADGREVTDGKSGLTWRRCAEGMTFKGGSCTGQALAIDHEDALKRAQSQKGWRLPNSNELLSIANESKFKMAIDTATFPNTPAEHFWTADPYIKNYFYAVNFYNGFRYDRYYTSQHHVRLVRDAK